MPNTHSKPHQVHAEPVMNDQVKLHSSRFDFSLVSLPDALIFSHGEPSVRFIHCSGWEASLFTHLPQYEDNIISFILLPVGFVDRIERFIPLISGNQMLNEPPSSMKCSTVWRALVLSLAQESIISKFFFSNLSSCSWTLKASFFIELWSSLCVSVTPPPPLRLDVVPESFPARTSTEAHLTHTYDMHLCPFPLSSVSLSLKNETYLCHFSEWHDHNLLFHKHI